MRLPINIGFGLDQMGQEVKIRLINFNKKRLGGRGSDRIEGFDNRAPAHLG